MEAIATVLTAPDAQTRLAAVHSLLSRLEEGNLDDKRISSLLRENLNLLARKVVDRTGDTGEHYIATSRAEYHWMWRAAIGGGLLTVFTAAIKMRIVEARSAAVLRRLRGRYQLRRQLRPAAGLRTGAGYQAAGNHGGNLRAHHPRQPRAGALQQVERSSSRASPARNWLRRLGNVLAVSAGAVVFEWLYKLLFAHSYLARESASHVYETLHPFSSGTAFYAIVTGVILWLAALAGSWLENAAVYYDLSEAIAQHPLGLRLSERATKKFATWCGTTWAAGAPASCSATCWDSPRSSAPFFGVPLDVRHVTLSTRNSGAGRGALRNRQPGRSLVSLCGRRNRRRVRAEPDGELHDCACTSRCALTISACASSCACCARWWRKESVHPCVSSCRNSPEPQKDRQATAPEETH